MKAMLYGFRRMDFVNDDGDRVCGYSCYIGYASDGVIGQETAKQWVSSQMAKSCQWEPKVGAQLEIDFTPRGRVCAVANVEV
ncbi:MAG: hypothetical protein HFF90_11985 [Oscillibacter sp.]|nr:hypothetical protein [Oscillibacter sp.]